MTDHKPCDQDALIDVIAGAVDAANFGMRPEYYGKGAGAVEMAAAINNIARDKARDALAAIAAAGYEIRPPGKPCDPADPCSTAYDLASERNTLDGLWAETKDRLDAAMAQVTQLRGALRRTATDIRAQAKASELYARDERRWPGVPSATEISIGNFREIADRAERAALAETADTPAPAPTDDGWTAWEGGECPVAGGTMVEVVFRSRIGSAVGLARNWDWSRGPAPVSYAIVAYRIVEARDET